MPLQLAQVAGAAFNGNSFSKAIAIYQNIILKFPHLSDPYYRIAYIYRAQGEYRKALVAIDKAIETSFSENVENNKYKQFQAFILAKINNNN